MVDCQLVAAGRACVSSLRRALATSRSIVARVLASGRAWVAATSFEGSDIIRVCVTHGETTADDIMELVDTLHVPDEMEVCLHP